MKYDCVRKILGWWDSDIFGCVQFPPSVACVKFVGNYLIQAIRHFCKRLIFQEPRLIAVNSVQISFFKKDFFLIFFRAVPYAAPYNLPVISVSSLMKITVYGSSSQDHCHSEELWHRSQNTQSQRDIKSAISFKCTEWDFESICLGVIMAKMEVDVTLCEQSPPAVSNQRKNYVTWWQSWMVFAQVEQGITIGVFWTHTLILPWSRSKSGPPTLLHQHMLTLLL